MKIDISDVQFLARRPRESATIPAGLNPPMLASEMSVLDYLVHHLEAVCVGHIARGASLAQSGISTVVTRLKSGGWITTRLPPENTRSTLVAVCPQVITGMKQVLRGDGNSFIEQLLAGASQQKRSVALRGLAVLSQHLRGTETRLASQPETRAKGSS